jgi:hypothetical protein
MGSQQSRVQNQTSCGREPAAHSGAFSFEGYGGCFSAKITRSLAPPPNPGAESTARTARIHAHPANLKPPPTETTAASKSPKPIDQSGLNQIPPPHRSTPQIPPRPADRPPEAEPLRPENRRSDQLTPTESDARTHATGLSGVWGSEEAALPSSRAGAIRGLVVPPPPPSPSPSSRGRARGGFGSSARTRNRCLPPPVRKRGLGVIEWGCVCFFEGKGSGSLIYRGSREEYLIRCAVGPAVSEGLAFNML